jgi:hypothetical protein
MRYDKETGTRPGVSICINLLVMSKGERSTSIGTIIGLGFIVLGFLNLFATLKYHKTSLNTASRIPGMLFIAVGITIIIIKTIKKTRE